MRGLTRLDYIPDSTFANDLDALVAMYRILFSEMQVLAQALRPVEGLLRVLGVWDEHYAHRYTADSYLNHELNPLRELIGWDAALRAEMEVCRLPDDADFTASLDAYLDRRGQRGLYELDLACPRFRDAPEVLIPMLLLPQAPSQAPRSLMGWLTLPIWRAADAYLRGQSRIRRVIVENMTLIRDHLLALAEDVLDDPEDLWLLDIDEVKRLDTGWRPDDALLDQHRANGEMSSPGSRRPPS